MDYFPDGISLEEARKLKRRFAARLHPDNQETGEKKQFQAMMAEYEQKFEQKPDDDLAAVVAELLRQTQAKARERTRTQPKTKKKRGSQGPSGAPGPVKQTAPRPAPENPLAEQTICQTLRSPFLTEMVYTPSTQTLYLSMRGGREYWYEGVPYSVALGLSQARKPGAYFSEHIKGIYSSGKLV